MWQKTMKHALYFLCSDKTWVFDQSERQRGPIYVINSLSKHGLLTKCEVKKAGYCPSSFFCMFIDWDEVEVHKQQEQGQYAAILTEQAWSMKDLLYGIKHQNMINFPCGTKPVSREGKIAPSCPLG